MPTTTKYDIQDHSSTASHPTITNDTQSRGQHITIISPYYVLDVAVVDVEKSPDPVEEPKPQKPKHHGIPPKNDKRERKQWLRSMRGK